MADVMNIQKLVKAAAAKELAKQATSVDSARNSEHEEDIKAIPANVDSQTAADAVGALEKDPAMNIGTKAEATTDGKIDGLAKETNDDKAFKCANDLQKLAGSIIAGIEAAVAKEATVKEAEETAITVDAPEGTAGKNTADDPGKEESIEGGEANGEAAQTTDSGTQTAAVKPEVAVEADPEKDPAEKSAGTLAADIYTMAQEFLVAPEHFTKQAGIDEELTEADVEGLEDSEADELAAALEASALDAAGEGTEDADNVAQYLNGYQDLEGAIGAEGLGAEDPMPEVVAPEAGQDGDVEALLKMLQEADVSPEELQGLAAQKEASVKEEDDAWKALSKEAKHEVVLNVLEGLQSK